MRANIAYVPVVHRGYVDYFTKNPGRIMLIDPSLVPAMDYLSREARALELPVVADLLRVALRLDYLPEIFTIENEKQFAGIVGGHDSIVMPDEDISHAVAEKFFPEARIQYTNAFLRWNWGNVVKEESIVPDRTIEETLLGDVVSVGNKVKERSPDWWRQVGAVILRDGVILGTAFNTHFPSAYSVSLFGDPRTPFRPGERIEVTSAHHAEKELIAWAAKNGVSTNGAEVFVTTFPCPNCAKDLVSAGIQRVYYQEGYSLVAAQEILRTHGVEIVKVVGEKKE